MVNRFLQANNNLKQTQLSQISSGDPASTTGLTTVCLFMFTRAQLRKPVARPL